jgi:hypothetical protein
MQAFTRQRVKAFLIICGGITILLAAIILEGWRQERRLRARGESPGTRPSLIGTGMLELQRHLEPERRVEVVELDRRHPDRVRPEHLQGARDDRTSPNGSDD